MFVYGGAAPRTGVHVAPRLWTTVRWRVRDDVDVSVSTLLGSCLAVCLVHIAVCDIDERESSLRHQSVISLVQNLVYRISPFRPRVGYIRVTHRKRDQNGIKRSTFF